MKYTNIIDPHVHMRWNEYKEWGFAQAALRTAQAVGIRWIIEMPNTNPEMIDELSIYDRSKVLREFEERTGVGRSVHVGATTNIQQVVDAMRIAKGESHAGLKVYFTHSTGDMGILDRWWQRLIWQVASDQEYKGVILGHFEDEKAYGLPSFTEWADIGQSFDLSVTYKDADTYYASVPATHSLRQHEDAELKQVRRQIECAQRCGFKGKFYICHVSSPRTVEYVESRRAAGLDFEVVLEVTWHHMFLNTEAYKEFGNHAKMNPPLRIPDSQKKLLQMVLDGRIDLIGSDHAPHPPEKKNDQRHPASGVQALQFWPRGIELLRSHGIDEGLLRRMTFEKAQELFDIPVKAEEVEVEYNKGLWGLEKDHPLASL